MKIFLTTSHNQFNQVQSLFNQIKINYDDLFKFIVVESGDEIDKYQLISDEEFIFINTNAESFWAESNSAGLNYIYKNYADVAFDLIILNCDIVLNEWVSLENVDELITFYTVDKGRVMRSGYNISNWFIAKHEYPFLNRSISEALAKQVDIVPTRFIFIPNRILNTVWGIIPNFTKLPHYISDLEFTYRLGKLSSEKWTIKNNTFIEEDYSTTGVKNITGNVIERFKVLKKRKSIYNFKDRFWYSYLITKDKSLFVKTGYCTSSILKLLIQVFRT